jgi:hypothetical protein
MFELDAYERESSWFRSIQDIRVLLMTGLHGLDWPKSIAQNQCRTLKKMIDEVRCQDQSSCLTEVADRAGPPIQLS